MEEKRPSHTHFQIQSLKITPKSYFQPKILQLFINNSKNPIFRTKPRPNCINHPKVGKRFEEWERKGEEERVYSGIRLMKKLTELWHWYYFGMGRRIWFRDLKGIWWIWGGYSVFVIMIKYCNCIYTFMNWGWIQWISLSSGASWHASWKNIWMMFPNTPPPDPPSLPRFSSPGQSIPHSPTF